MVDIFNVGITTKSSPYNICCDNIDKQTKETDESIFGDIMQFDCLNLFEDNFKDGKIDNTRQQKLDDCWILSDINSLSYTQEGQKILKESLDYQKEGVVVHMKAAGDYLISYSEVNKAAKSGKYSKGDKDMVVFELAMERVLNDVKEGNIEVAQDAPFYIETGRTIQDTRGDKSAIDSGRTSEMIYYLTGKHPKVAYNKDEMREMLIEAKENNGKDLALCFYTSDYKKICKDIDNNYFTIAKNHALAIKEVKDDTVTIVNPWNSGKEYKLSTDEFLNTAIGLHCVDLS